MTLDGASQPALLKSQKLVRELLARTAGVEPAQVLFYNYTASTDPRTAVSTVSLTTQVACTSVAQCGAAGLRLFDPKGQANITRALGAAGLDVLLSTFQVYGSDLTQGGIETLNPLVDRLTARSATAASATPNATNATLDLPAFNGSPIVLPAIGDSGLLNVTAAAGGAAVGALTTLAAAAAAALMLL